MLVKLGYTPYPTNSPLSLPLSRLAFCLSSVEMCASSVRVAALQTGGEATLSRLLAALLWAQALERVLRAARYLVIKGCNDITADLRPTCSVC